MHTIGYIQLDTLKLLRIHFITAHLKDVLVEFIV